MLRLSSSEKNRVAMKLQTGIDYPNPIHSWVSLVVPQKCNGQRVVVVVAADVLVANAELRRAAVGCDFLFIWKSSFSLIVLLEASST